MGKDELINCEFVNEYLRFVTFDDFCKNYEIIKTIYSTLNKNSKQFYKWYVYANVFLDEAKKNIIWEFLNAEEPTWHIKLFESRKRKTMPLNNL